ncbi:AbrB family looped-hinge helix DNA binding protein [Trueperella bonasi]|uniref:AbrB family looped-hinge helix DNA binding protein n=1 Tax=Trueperella bonasi TaxID=312286 RepID=A0ABT9NGA3_9ACTO|nr:AbrB/MazE/SpoVT family DNA-binding domain-containing protein [Trueperella bonasi]MDP9806436.1 AbrB family looped-hinge helix DNA binding protein [Trueperella bonasi]
MNLAKVSANGQITVPLEIRKALKLKTGDKVLFMQNQDGLFTIGNASEQAIYKAQSTFKGVAEKMGLESEDDVQALVDGLRSNS